MGSSGQAGRQDDLETWSREISPCDTGSGGRSGVCAQPEVSKFPSSGQQRPLILFFFSFFWLRRANRTTESDLGGWAAETRAGWRLTADG